jgi:hypothetical protein
LFCPRHHTRQVTINKLLLLKWLIKLLLLKFGIDLEYMYILMNDSRDNTVLSRDLILIDQQSVGKRSLLLMETVNVKMRWTIIYYRVNHRLSINRSTKRGKEMSPSDGHCQCEKETDDHLMACQ